MTTAIPDIADLVKVLRDQPEWAETLRAVLLTQELLELPEKVAQLTARLEEFIAEQRETNRLFVEQMARQNARIDEFIAEQKEINRLFAAQLARQEADSAELKAAAARQEGDISEVKSDVAELKATAARQETDIAELKSDMVAVKSDIAELKSDMAVVKSDVAVVKSDVAELKATTSRQETDMAQLKATVNHLSGQVSRLVGADLERKVHARIAGQVSERLELDCVQVLQSVMVATVPELFDLLSTARSAGRISRAQSRSLLRADIILSAQDDREQLIYVVVEVSRTVQDYDLTRARERADILAAASAAPTVALALGYIISPPQRQKAAELGVQLLESANLAAIVDDED